MSFRVAFRVTGGDALKAVIAAKKENLRDLRPFLSIAGALERDAAKMRIREEGENLDPSWIPSQKTLTRTFGSGAHEVTVGGSGKTGYDTGNMSNSIEYRLVSENAVRIGTGVPYAKWFQNGSGVFAGHSSWTIRPRDKQLLSWTFGGQRFFAREVTISGSPPRPFLLFTEADIAAVMSEFHKHLARNAQARLT